jgi:hypothetical protein
MILWSFLYFQLSAINIGPQREVEDEQPFAPGLLVELILPSLI